MLILATCDSNGVILISTSIQIFPTIFTTDVSLSNDSVITVFGASRQSLLDYLICTGSATLSSGVTVRLGGASTVDVSGEMIFEDGAVVEFDRRGAVGTTVVV